MTAKISPTFHILPDVDGLSHVMFANRRDSYYLPLQKTSQILESNGIPVVRKVVEQFANGVTVHSMYFQPTSEEKLQKILNDLSLVFIARQTPGMMRERERREVEK